MIFALAGNQNCGKTTLFNQLTGSNQHVGNFPGVTVEKKEGRIRHSDNSVVDLPGIYSLSPYTAEEVVTRDFLIKAHPDGIINIIDATNIQRNLYLTLQLIELGIPMVVALNMMDEVEESGGRIDVAGLEDHLGVPVIPISASKNQGISTLITRAFKTAEAKKPPLKVDFCSGPVHRAIHSTAHLIEDHAAAKGYPVRYAAVKLIENDQPAIAELELNQNELELLGHIRQELEDSLGTDCEAALADMRYSFIGHIARECVFKPGDTLAQKRSQKLDAVFAHKYFAIPLFIAIMGLVFWLTFDVIGGWLSGLLEEGIGWLTQVTDAGLAAISAPRWLHSLIIDGIFAGVGSVVTFLPIIVGLFFFLSLLEDSGYIARVAFVMDKLLRKIGLSGRSLVPMLIGFGCSVPAIMSTRTLPSSRDRKLTILLIPFMSCSAKLPIYAVFSAAFFPNHSALVMIILYIFGMLIGIACALLLGKTAFAGRPDTFVLELPAYRLPSPKSLLLHMWEKGKDFLHKAFTVILAATIVIWFLQNFDFRLHMVTDASTSILAVFGSFFAPLFEPLGFGDWRGVSALVTGLTAKEMVVSTLAVLLGANGKEQLIPLLSGIFTPLSAASFLVFTLLYTPCVAALNAARREFGSFKGALAMLCFQLGVAWFVSFWVFQLGRLFGI